MSRLRNRMTRAEFWTDPDLLSWPRDKRFFYMGLRSLAEDSGCMEDSPFGWMLVLYPSPLDRDITIETVTRWRDELIADGKLIPYVAGGKRCLYQATFHDHEHPRNPQAPSLPLPPWLHWNHNEKDARKGRYDVDPGCLPASESSSTSVIQPLYNDATTVPAQPRPAQPRTKEHRDTSGFHPSGPSKQVIWDNFLVWWSAYGKVGSRADAAVLYNHWVKKGAAPEDLLLAAQNYHEHCLAKDSFQAHGRTFLAKKPNRWKEWVKPEKPPSGNGHGPAPDGKKWVQSYDIAKPAGERYIWRLVDA